LLIITHGIHIRDQFEFFENHQKKIVLNNKTKTRAEAKEQGTSPVYNIPVEDEHEEELTTTFSKPALKLKGLTGGQIFLEMMKRHNVEQVFGFV